jgi:hypothetical protein
MNATEGRRWKAQLVKSIDADLAKKHRATVKALRDQEALERGKLREALHHGMSACRAEWMVEKARIEGWRARAIARVRAAAKQAKERARHRCTDLKLEIQTTVGGTLAAVVARRLEEQRDFARLERAGRAAKARQRSRATRREQKAESEDQVIANIEPHLIPLWNKVKHQIRGSDRWSRTEEFLHFVEEHPHEVHDAIEREVEREMRALAAKAAKAAKAPKTTAGRTRSPSSGPSLARARRRPSAELEPDESEIRPDEVILDSDFDAAALGLAS